MDVFRLRFVTAYRPYLFDVYAVVENFLGFGVVYAVDPGYRVEAELVVLVVIAGFVRLCRQRDPLCLCARVWCCAFQRFRTVLEVPVACDFCFSLDPLLVSAFLPFSAVIEDLFRDLVCALRIFLTYPFENISVKLVYFIEVYCVCFVVQSFAYILGICLCFLCGL